MRAIAFGTLAALALYTSIFLAVALVPRSGPAALAVVFGSEVLADGTPSPRLAARLNRAVLAYRQGQVPLILVSGALGGNGYDEANVMSAYLASHGVKPDAILTDSEGLDTMSTARHAAAIMQRMKLGSVLAVTQYFHIPRAMLALRRAGAPDVVAAYPLFFEWQDIYGIARELIAYPTYLLRAKPSVIPDFGR
jgi:vancomycin permeability regulator SanA